MQLPHLNVVEAALLGALAKATYDSAVAALPKPDKTTGFYLWFYSFTRNEAAAVDGYLDARFHLGQPGAPVSIQPALTITEPAPKEGK